LDASLIGAARCGASMAMHCLRSLVVRCNYARLGVSVANVIKISRRNLLWKTPHKMDVIFRTITRHAP
jgi:formyltetrahydrofolate hydrolase